MIKKKMNIDKIYGMLHKSFVPALYTLVWFIALGIGLFGNICLASVGLIPLISTMHGAVCYAFWTVYMSFIFEFIICIFDLTIQYRLERFSSGVLNILLMFAGITAGVLGNWFCYDKMSGLDPTFNIFLFMMILFASMQKFQSSWIQNNINRYIDTKPTETRQAIAA